MMANRTHVEVTPQELLSIVKAFFGKRNNCVAVLQVFKNVKDFPVGAWELFSIGKFEKKIKMQVADQVKKATKPWIYQRHEQFKDIINRKGDIESSYTTKEHPAEKRNENTLSFFFITFS